MPRYVYIIILGVTLANVDLILGCTVASPRAPSVALRLQLRLIALESHPPAALVAIETTALAPRRVSRGGRRQGLERRDEALSQAE